MTDIEMLGTEIRGFIDDLHPNEDKRVWARTCLQRLLGIAAPLGMAPGKSQSEDILQGPTADTVGDIVSRLGSELISINKLGDSAFRIMLADPQNIEIEKNIQNELGKKKKPGIYLNVIFTPGVKIGGRKNENNPS